MLTNESLNELYSAQVDLLDFSTECCKNRQLSTNDYLNACKDLATKVVVHAKQEGYTRLMVPAFAMSMNTESLNEQSKIEAARLMYQAFAEASAQHRLQVDWILWKGDPHHQKKQGDLASLPETSTSLIRPIINDDIILLVQKHQNLGENIVLLSPSSKGANDKLQKLIDEKLLPLTQDYLTHLKKAKTKSTAPQEIERKEESIQKLLALLSNESSMTPLTKICCFYRQLNADTQTLKAHRDPAWKRYIRNALVAVGVFLAIVCPGGFVALFLVAGASGAKAMTFWRSHGEDLVNSLKTYENRMGAFG